MNGDLFDNGTLKYQSPQDIYDDFMFGLKSNQHLYEEQERMYKSKVALLQSQYEAAVKMLLYAAYEQGVTLALPGMPLELTEGDTQ